MPTLFAAQQSRRTLTLFAAQWYPPATDSSPYEPPDQVDFRFDGNEIRVPEQNSRTGERRWREQLSKVSC